MKDYEKEVELAKLQAEEKELKHLKAIYNKAADDITKKIEISNGKISVLLANWDDLTDEEKSIYQSQIYQRNFQKSLKTQIDGFLKDLNSKQYATMTEYMEDCYKNGYLGAMYSIHKQGIPIISPIDQKKVTKAMFTDSKISKKLYTKLGEDVEVLKKRIANNLSRGIATASDYKVIARNIAADSNVGFNRAMRITRTEGNRISNESAYDASMSAKDKGADVVKSWDAALDGRTRDSHRQVDGEIRELDEKFSNGMMYPSDPAGGAAEVVNCRCALLQRAKWALDEEELQTLKDRAAYYGLDKTKNFEDFKSKYLKAGEMVEFENNPYVLTDLPPAIYEYPDYEEYRKAMDEWRSKHNESPYDYYVQESVWDTMELTDEQIDRIKRFDATVAKLQKDYPLPPPYSDNLYIGSYDSVGAYLSEIQQSRMDGGLAQAQFWFNPDDGRAVIGFNSAGLRGTLADDLLLRDQKIIKGERLSSVLDNSPEGIAIHEWGHGYADYISSEIVYGNPAAEEYWKWYKSLSKEDIGNGISNYAMTNRGEFEAECFAEILTGNPRPIAVKFSEYLDKCVEAYNKRVEMYGADAVQSGKAGKIDLALNYAIKHDTSSIKTIFLPKEEYAHVMSEIASNITEEQQKQKVLTKPIGDYFYTFENNGFGEYRIIGKKPIDEEALEWWDE